MQTTYHAIQQQTIHTTVQKCTQKDNRTTFNGPSQTKTNRELKYQLKLRSNYKKQINVGKELKKKKTKKMKMMIVMTKTLTIMMMMMMLMTMTTTTTKTKMMMMMMMTMMMMAMMMTTTTTMMMMTTTTMVMMMLMVMVMMERCGQKKKWKETEGALWWLRLSTRVYLQRGAFVNQVDVAISNRSRRASSPGPTTPKSICPRGGGEVRPRYPFTLSCYVFFFFKLS